MREEHPCYIPCASGHNVFTDCLVVRAGDLVRLLGHAQMDFAPEDAARLGQTLLARARDLGWRDPDSAPPPPKTTAAPAMSGDAIVDETISMLLARSKFGQEKYGTTLMRNDLDLLDWLRYAVEEGLDRTLYTLRAMKDLEKLYDDGR